MQLCDQFRALVDRSIARTPALDMPTVEERYAHKFEGAQPASRYTVLLDFIRQLLRSPSGLSSAEFRDMRKGLRYQSITGLPTEPYSQVADTLQDACGQDFSRPFSEEDVWLEAIDAARSCIVIHGALPDRDLRMAAVTEAALRLITAGYPVCVKDDHLHLELDQFDRLCADIEADIRILGGGTALIQIFGYMRSVHLYEFERYIPGRTFGFQTRLPSLPVGYLLNLGVKHLISAPIRDQKAAARIWTRVAERARDLCALYDVEPYHYIENIVLPPREVPRYLSSVALFDHIFALKQWPPSETIGLLKGLLDFVDQAKMRKLLGWTLDDTRQLAKFAFEASAGSDMCVMIDAKITSSGIDPSSWSAMRPHFVHSFGCANRDYVKPQDADKSDFGFKPLVEIHHKNLLLVSPSLAALGFFEAATRALRSAGYPRFEQDLGGAVERVVTENFRAHGLDVTIQGSTYTMFDPLTGEQQAGECDIVVETPESIVFVEAKKKPHRRVSATGDALANLIDLSGSLFDAQAQLARHERILLHHRHIRFDDGKRLDYKERNIERIAITLLDYGSLQDKYLLSQLFKALAGVSINASGTDNATAKKLAELNESVALLRKEIEELAKLGREGNKLFFNCWFFSAPQLLLLLDGINDPSGFAERLRKLKHFTFHTLDFFRDFGLARRGKFL